VSVSALACLLLAGCSGEDDPGLMPAPDVGPANVDVDTAELQALRSDAGIAP
jgi:hypothetical protein